MKALTLVFLGEIVAVFARHAHPLEVFVAVLCVVFKALEIGEAVLEIAFDFVDFLGYFFGVLEGI